MYGKSAKGMPKGMPKGKGGKGKPMPMGDDKMPMKKVAKKK